MIDVAVVSRGVMPLPVEMFGVTVPLNRIAVAPPPVLPVQKCETVSPPPVPAGKSMLASGVHAPLDTVQPLVVLATFTRAYEVYAASLVAIVPPSPGSPVLRPMWIFVCGEDAALSA